MGVPVEKTRQKFASTPLRLNTVQASTSILECKETQWRCQEEGGAPLEAFASRIATQLHRCPRRGRRTKEGLTNIGTPSAVGPRQVGLQKDGAGRLHRLMPTVAATRTDLFVVSLKDAFTMINNKGHVINGCAEVCSTHGRLEREWRSARQSFQMQGEPK